VLSHPFARKKAKGWGTELVQIHTVRDLEDVVAQSQAEKKGAGCTGNMASGSEAKNNRAVRT
jgi:hypothetical protein